MRFLIALFLSTTIFLSSTSVAHGQVGKDTDWWVWCGNEEGLRKSVVAIGSDTVMDDGRITQGLGCGSVVLINGKRRILTAAHVVCRLLHGNITNTHNKNIVIQFTTGKNAVKPVIIWLDTENDLAVLACDIPKGIPALKMAKSPAKRGEAIEILGLGGIEHGSKRAEVRHFKSTVSVASDKDTIWADTLTVPGDSGGPVLNMETNEVVGVVSGGRMYHATKKLKQGRLPVCYPARLGRADKIEDRIK